MHNNDLINTVKGKLADGYTRCVHYHSHLDVIAIKFKCCGEYYPCYNCHIEDTTHPVEVWDKSEFNTRAILCGVCSGEMTIAEYFACNYQCPSCNAAFNPKCKNHHHLYFSKH